MCFTPSFCLKGRKEWISLLIQPIKIFLLRSAQMFCFPLQVYVLPYSRAPSTSNVSQDVETYMSGGRQGDKSLCRCSWRWWWQHRPCWSVSFLAISFPSHWKPEHAALGTTMMPGAWLHTPRLTTDGTTAPARAALGMCVLLSQPWFKEDLVSLTHEFSGNII